MNWVCLFSDFLKKNNIYCKGLATNDLYPEWHILCELKDLRRITSWLYDNKPMFIGLVIYLKNDIKQLTNFKFLNKE